MDCIDAPSSRGVDDEPYNEAVAIAAKIDEELGVQKGIKQVLGSALGGRIARIRYSFANDWSGSYSVYFRVVLKEGLPQLQEQLATAPKPKGGLSTLHLGQPPGTRPSS